MNYLKSKGLQYLEAVCHLVDDVYIVGGRLVILSPSSSDEFQLSCKLSSSLQKVGPPTILYEFHESLLIGRGVGSPPTMEEAGLGEREPAVGALLQLGDDRIVDVLDADGDDVLLRWKTPLFSYFRHAKILNFEPFGL